ncbi:2Fe-2S iron-sulfur cluster binding domain-containing protein [Rhodococcus sp. USK10]|uniref:Ferredoxin, 2Fe-2S n=1 Tax=Rhodococcus wratislaviensis TaxID=44752 RepID=A0A402CF08_RHOWR|nr:MULTISPECIES: 2Fe-2S iron-sulfur cluster-binding protein [Rhodococcus]QYB07106.1 2Fe-2S iron-sulfur cluster binding domain-containing protein [Rhodococcus sp. USK10]GCE42137.1 Ferredoxin, 2Fe-2S [Rhodococcus wratislaviensis]
MPKVTYKLPDGSAVTVDAEVGDSVMSAALQNGVDGIIGECGGACACATCHVFVDAAFLPEISELEELEDDMLEGVAVDRRPTSRLSCQISLVDVLDGLVVEIPGTQL